MMKVEGHGTVLNLRVSFNTDSELLLTLTDEIITFNHATVSII